WVLAFEIFIPLVLFFILLGLRQKKPAIAVKEAFYSAAPLTSAGIIPIMQSLCPDGQRDEFGFLQYQNSTVSQLLERISQVAEQNRLFTSEGPGLGQELETLQQHLDSLSSAPSSPDLTFNKTQGETDQGCFLQAPVGSAKWSCRSSSVSEGHFGDTLYGSVQKEKMFGVKGGQHWPSMMRTHMVQGVPQGRAGGGRGDVDEGDRGRGAGRGG
ncbi:hypothetical protein fugu_004539, partial [Takifugu bimaculatus]